MSYVINDIENIAVLADTIPFYRLCETSMIFITEHRSNQFNYEFKQQHKLFFSSVKTVNVCNDFEEFFEINKMYFRELSKAEMSSIYLAMLNNDILITEHKNIIKVSKLFNVKTISARELLEISLERKNSINSKIKVRV